MDSAFVWEGTKIFWKRSGRIKGLAEGGFSGREITRRVRRSPQRAAKSKLDKALLAAQGQPKAQTDRQVRQVVRAAATGD
ncbi:hypothetical protein PPTG_24315 [Phytophthora nicotianae INRA-310]|uniref:Uncharacterized protein n=1 Tax=Phytophthora nicotianae (strain INRA-310) TaxID=761204 RepID=W2PJB0_PHYN3|nr:hypothetical protein PPTG_24315 [Phytophthora nicotianae INRA-310]ETN00115.1 hypothetical protein PPTG_24315 [Phytophthora nicotianae INRA-310]